MTLLVLAPRVLEALQRLTDVLLNNTPQAAPATGHVLLYGRTVLKRHPLIGSGCLAVYWYDADHDRAIILAVRQQREQGHIDP